MAPHIAVGVLIVVVAEIAYRISRRLPGRRNQVAPLLSGGSTLAAGVSGLVFVYGGEIHIALYSMEGFTVFVLIGAILMLV